MGKLELLTIFEVFSLVQGYDWSYHHQHNSWGGVCDSGGSQSPINIVPTMWHNLPPWSFNNYNLVNTFNITNNGHTVKLYMDARETISISGASLPGKFIFAQGHFHWGNKSSVGSEHLIRGKAFPLELHLVHFNSKYLTIKEALKYKDGLAVVAVLYELSEEDNKALSAVTDVVQNIRSKGLKFQADKKVSLKSFLPSDTSGFYRYSGSLTTPTCDEVVTWSVLHQTNTVSENQLHQLRNIMDSDGFTMGNNFRSSQPLNSRKVVASGVLPPVPKSAPYVGKLLEMPDIGHVEDNTANRHPAMVLVTLAMIVLFTQCGFVFLEAGAMRTGDMTVILTRNMLAASSGAVVYWAIGFCLTWGDGDHPFSGNTYLVGIGLQEFLLSKLFFEFTFSLTAASLASSCLSGRCSFRAFLVYNILFVGFIFPILAHWAWHPSGWLHQHGFHDLAGSAVVHLSGASCALVGCLILVPKENKISSGKVIIAHDDSLSALGSFILIFGYIAQNAGKLEDEEGVVGVVTNTVMAGCVGAISCQIINKMFLKDKMREISCMNGALTGVVAISGGCDVFSTWVSMVIGLLSGASYSLASRLLLHLNLDDPADVVAVNGVGGILGCLFVPLLREDGLGVFYTWSSQSGFLLLWNIVGVFSTIAWCGGIFSLIFFLLNKSAIFRLGAADDKVGYQNSRLSYSVLSSGHCTFQTWRRGSLDRTKSLMIFMIRLIFIL